MTIREQLKKHDQLSFELKLEFPFTSKKKKRSGNYYVNMFLFVPNSLDINKQSYPKSNFYGNLKTYIRFTTPQFKLRQMVKGKSSPFNELKSTLERYLSLPGKAEEEQSETLIKRFCSIFGTSLRRATLHILRQKEPGSFQKEIIEFSAQVQNVRSRFKSLEPLLQKAKNENLLSLFRFADEYQSLLVERNLFTFFTALEKRKRPYHKEEVQPLEHLVSEEMNYREQRGYPTVAYAGRSNEYVLHRASRLKKYIESNLFLNTDTRKDGVVVEQVLFALAAGLAMVFATSVAFVSQMIYGNLTLPFFIALVVSYMFKDRIKELVRIYLNKKQHKFVQDFKTNIYDRRNRKIGYLKESFGFVKHTHLPAPILNARNSMRITGITNNSLGEKIILHRNRVKIFNKKVKSLNEFSGTTEILRLNISDFTKNMDDPEKEIFVKTKKGFKKGKAKRSYHLNLILNYSDGKEEKIKLYKLIVNRNGIQRIEKYKHASAPANGRKQVYEKVMENDKK